MRARARTPDRVAHRRVRKDDISLKFRSRRRRAFLNDTIRPAVRPSVLFIVSTSTGWSKLLGSASYG
eukprot:COSAG02_NODE_43780_length_371_cov_2.886029_1_plen_66_part_01